MSDREVSTWWHVEADLGHWHMVGCRYDTLAEASEWADRIRDRNPKAKYRVVRVDSIREIEDEA